jgi:hypothetical protein
MCEVRGVVPPLERRLPRRPRDAAPVPVVDHHHLAVHAGHERVGHRVAVVAEMAADPAGRVRIEREEHVPVELLVRPAVEQRHPSDEPLDLDLMRLARGPSKVGMNG